MLQLVSDHLSLVFRCAPSLRKSAGLRHTAAFLKATYALSIRVGLRRFRSEVVEEFLSHVVRWLPALFQAVAVSIDAISVRRKSQSISS